MTLYCRTLVGSSESVLIFSEINQEGKRFSVRFRYVDTTHILC